jgi:hypothetical protein
MEKVDTTSSPKELEEFQKWERLRDDIIFGSTN